MESEYGSQKSQKERKQNLMPKFSGAGFIINSAFTPLCKPTPFNLIGLLIVFWLVDNIWEVYKIKLVFLKQKIFQKITLLIKETRKYPWN